MTKRNKGKFEPSPRDFYSTPKGPCKPLLHYLKDQQLNFAEPCAGDGTLFRFMQHLSNNKIKCTFACDIEPKDKGIRKMDALELVEKDLSKNGVDVIITNPPWSRDTLHQLIDFLPDLRPTFLLFDTNWMHQVQSIPYLPRLRRVISVGRVSWMMNNVSGFDDCAWYEFGPEVKDNTIEFIGRVARF